MADKAYSSKAIRQYLRDRGIQCVIPEREDQKANRTRKGKAGGLRQARADLQIGSVPAGCAHLSRAIAESALGDTPSGVCVGWLNFQPEFSTTRHKTLTVQHLAVSYRAVMKHR